MKKIIDGKIYNTETATEVCSYEYGSGRMDFSYCKETLYMTPRGAWFIHGEGGPMSKYARSVSENEWTGGEGIRVLSAEEARRFIEANADIGTYTDYFDAQEA